MTTIQAMRVRPADEHGGVLTSRGLAAALRERIEDAIRAGDDVVVDLAGVETVSPSFADELFGKLAAQADAGEVEFRGIPATIEPLIRFVISGRSGGALPA